MGPGINARACCFTNLWRPPCCAETGSESREPRVHTEVEWALDRVVLHLDDGLRQVVDPADVYYLEARDEDTLVRLRSARPLADMRPLRELVPLFAPHGFLQIHREHVVNLRRIREIRRRDEGRDWEVKLEPPVNRVLPVSRGALAKLWKAFEAD